MMRIRKRKAVADPAGQPAAADGKARGGDLDGVVQQSNDRHRPPPLQRARPAQVPQISGFRKSGHGYKLLSDLSSKDAVPCSTLEEKKVDKSVKETRKGVATSEALITIPVEGCQAISRDHHPSEDNVSPMMEWKGISVVATERVPVTPLAVSNDVAPNVLPSNSTSDMGNEDHLADTRVLSNLAAIQETNVDNLFSGISLPAPKGDIISTESPQKNFAAEDQQGVLQEDHDSPMTEYTANTQSPNKNLAAEEQQGLSLEHHNLPMTESMSNTQSPNKNFAAEEQEGVSLADQDSPMTEYIAESSQSNGFSAVNQFSTYLGNSVGAEHGDRLTSPEDYRPLLQQSKITDQPSEHLSIESQPFLKTLPSWGSFEEMEIFKTLPQRPHFHPLKELGLGPDFCESMAIGLMTFFVKTAENIRRLSIQDDKELFNEKFKGLSLLEDHGFDVRHLRSRLDALLNIKNKHCELQDATKRMEEEIILKEIDRQQSDAQICKLYTAIHELESQANLLRSVLKSSISQKKADCLEISRLKTKGCNIKQSYLTFEQLFGRVVAAPW